MRLKDHPDSPETVDLLHIIVSTLIAAAAALIVTTLVALGVGTDHPATWVTSAVIVVGGTVWLAQQDIRRLWEGAWQ